MIEGRTIVCASTTDWDEVWGSRQQIMTTLARRNRVVYVERQVGPEHLARYPELRGRWKVPERRETADGIMLLRPPLLWPGRYFSRSVDRLAQGRLAGWLARHLRHLGVREAILWIYPPNSHLLPRLLRPAVSIYHCIDRFAGQSRGWKARTIATEEAATLRSVDACLAYSRAIFEDHRRVQPRTFYWPNGCDFARIRAAFEREAPEPPDLAAIPRPRLGHMGSVAGKTDLALIDFLSRTRPDWQLVFVGNEYLHDLDRARWTELKARPNVHFLGPRPIADVPAYEKGFDVNLCPWMVNDWTRELQPIKIFEYLATGRPIVSTRLPELAFLVDTVAFADSHEEFAAACAAALADRRPDAEALQLARAARWAWDERLAEAARLLAEAGIPI